MMALKSVEIEFKNFPSDSDVLKIEVAYALL
jgi:hypothetical protein